MPRIEKQPHHEQNHRGHKQKSEHGLAEKKFQNKEQQRAEEHQPTANAMSCAPSGGTFQGPRCAEANKIIRALSRHVVTQNRHQQQRAPDHHSSAGIRVTQWRRDLNKNNRIEKKREGETQNLQNGVHAMVFLQGPLQFRIERGQDAQKRDHCNSNQRQDKNFDRF